MIVPIQVVRLKVRMLGLARSTIGIDMIDSVMSSVKVRITLFHLVSVAEVKFAQILLW
jgi:hypothetical protein